MYTNLVRGIKQYFKPSEDIVIAFRSANTVDLREVQLPTRDFTGDTRVTKSALKLVK